MTAEGCDAQTPHSNSGIDGDIAQQQQYCLLVVSKAMSQLHVYVSTVTSLSTVSVPVKLLEMIKDVCQ